MVKKHNIHSQDFWDGDPIMILFKKGDRRSDPRSFPILFQSFSDPFPILFRFFWNFFDIFVHYFLHFFKAIYENGWNQKKKRDKVKGQNWTLKKKYNLNLTILKNCVNFFRSIMRFWCLKNWEFFFLGGGKNGTGTMNFQIIVETFLGVVWRR